jgi:hypothetical protein
MALPSSGIIKISDIASEFQDTVPYKFSKYYRGGALVPNSSQNTNVPTNGAMKLSNFYGAVRRIAAVQTYSANTTQTTLNVSTLPGYQAGKTDVTITVNSGIYLYSTSVSNPALTISGAVAGDTVTLVNNGYIMGMGGDGGTYGGRGGNNGFNGYDGGPAISLSNSIYLTNNSYIGGGGGGGGGAAGGGAGGGQGGAYNGGSHAAGGGPGQSGANNGQTSGGGGGGRIMPGVGGSTVASGGGAGGAGTASPSFTSNFGAGGSAGNAGSAAGGAYGTGGGGGWGAVGGASSVNTAGVGGAAIVLNGYSVTYNVTGTIYGAVA